MLLRPAGSNGGRSDTEDHGPGRLAIRALLDTNVLASGLIGLPRELSVPGEILRRWLVGRFSLVISEPILYELQYSVFMSAYFQQRLPAERMVALLQLLREEAIIADLTIEVTGKSPDPDDDHVLAAALSAAVDYLVTGDRQLRSVHEFGGIKLLTPREFLDRLESI